MRAKTDVKQIGEDLVKDLQKVRQWLEHTQAPETVMEAFAGLETHSAISLRVFSKTNPSKIRSEAVTVEIQVRMAGRPVLPG